MTTLSSLEFIISCEHAGKQIPDGYTSLFNGAEEILNSHRGWDLGALELATLVSEKTGSKLFTYLYSRLLIDTNRSIGHPKLFSEFTRNLSEPEKQEIINKYYQPYRNEVVAEIQKNASELIPTIHIGVHTFTPVLDESVRNFEIGLLYDPQRESEKEFCRFWKLLLKKDFPDYRIRMNEPYKGASDGFTTSLRTMFDEKFYLGIELEINQKIFLDDNEWIRFCSNISENFNKLRERFTLT